MGTSPVINFVQYFDLLLHSVICCFWFVDLQYDLLFLICCFMVWFVVLKCDLLFYSVISWLSVRFVVLQFVLSYFTVWFVVLQWVVVFTVWLVVCQCDLLFHMSLFLCITHFVHYYNSNSVPKIQKVYRKFPRKQIPWNSHRPTPDGAVHGPDGTTHITSLHRTLKKKLKKSGYVDLCLYCKI